MRGSTDSSHIPEVSCSVFEGFFFSDRKGVGDIPLASTVY